MTDESRDFPDEVTKKLQVSAIEQKLQLTYEQRIEAHENARQLANDLKKAGEQLRAESQSSS